MPSKKAISTAKKGRTASKKSSASAKKVTPKPKKAVIKTTETAASVDTFLGTIKEEQKRADCYTIIRMMEKASGAPPKMWGSAIIGFGNRVYTSPATGRQVDWMLIGFSPRKANITLYLMNMAMHTAALKKLGKHKIGGGCLYINKLSDVDTTVLQGMIKEALKQK